LTFDAGACFFALLIARLCRALIVIGFDARDRFALEGWPEFH
jgi:hypothetical protein